MMFRFSTAAFQVRKLSNYSMGKPLLMAWFYLGNSVRRKGLPVLILRKMAMMVRWLVIPPVR